jgi:hypothetical protein
MFCSTELIGPICKIISGMYKAFTWVWNNTLGAL